MMGKKVLLFGFVGFVALVLALMAFFLAKPADTAEAQWLPNNCVKQFVKTFADGVVDEFTFRHLTAGGNLAIGCGAIAIVKNGDGDDVVRGRFALGSYCWPEVCIRNVRYKAAGSNKFVFVTTVEAQGDYSLERVSGWNKSPGKP